MTCGEREKTRARCLATGECVCINTTFFACEEYTCSLCKVRMTVFIN